MMESNKRNIKEVRHFDKTRKLVLSRIYEVHLCDFPKDFPYSKREFLRWVVSLLTNFFEDPIIDLFDGDIFLRRFCKEDNLTSFEKAIIEELESLID